MNDDQYTIDRDFVASSSKRRTRMLAVCGLFLVVVAAFIAKEANAQTPTFSCTPTTGASPLSSACTWNVPGAATCTAAGTGAWTGSVPTSGTRNFSGITTRMTLTLACTGPGSPGSALLTWTHDGKNTDGSNATLAGFTVLYGVTATALTQTVLVNNAAVRTQTVDNLAAGTWFFAVKARSSIAESSNSNVSSKAVTATPGAALPVLSVVLDPVATPTAPVLTVDTNAMEIRPNSTGTLVATRVGLVPMGVRCYADTRKAGNVTYNGVPIELVDFVNWPVATNLREAWAKCG